MRTQNSPCAKRNNRDTCDDLDGVCKKFRKWVAAAWPRITARATTGFSTLRLYRAGKNDREISAAVGVSSMTICQWRKRNGLPPVGKRGPRPESEAPPC